MYQIAYTNTSLQKIKEVYTKSPSILNNIKSLAENPYEKALKINRSGFSDYYVNCGKYCILLNIIDETSSIDLILVVHRSFLYRAMAKAS